MLSYQVLITFQASRYITLNMSSQFGSIVLGTHLVCRIATYPFVEWSLIMFRVCPFCCGSTRQLMRYHMHRPRNIFTRWLAHSRGSILSIVMFCFVDCIVYHAHHICAHYPRWIDTVRLPFEWFRSEFCLDWWLQICVSQCWVCRMWCRTVQRYELNC